MLIKQVIDEGNAKKHASKGIMKQAWLNKAERKANSTTHDGGHGQDRGRTDGCGSQRDSRGKDPGHGPRCGGNQSSSAKTFVNRLIWKQLTPEVQTIIRNRAARKTNTEHHQINATQRAHGAILLPNTLWF